MCLIARDEADQVAPCFDSFWPHVDEVVFIDTGSKDDTLTRAAAYAYEHGEPEKLVIGEFEWIDDFAKARAYADELASGEWRAWADLDDVIQGAAHFPRLVENAPPELTAYIAGYDYARDQHGNTACFLKRERLVRRGSGTWHGRVHEAQVLEGAVTELDPAVCLWVHNKPAGRPTDKRNLRILRAWLKDEPENPRVLAYIGTEEMARGRMSVAKRYLKRYLKLKTGWDEERAQVHRKLAICLMAEKRFGEAIDTAFEAMRVVPSWTDSYLSLAEAYYSLGEHQKSAQWAEEALRRGQPDSLLILNPLDYVFQTRKVLAGALGGLGDLDAAITIGEQALQVVPDDGDLMQAFEAWRTTRKRESTAQTVVSLSQMLVSHDEQKAALDLLEQSVPHFAKDHPLVVAARSELRERLLPLYDPDGYSDHYRTGGSQPEHFVEDEQLDQVAGSIHRCHFLLEGLREQLGIEELREAA